MDSSSRWTVISAPSAAATGVWSSAARRMSTSCPGMVFFFPVSWDSLQVRGTGVAILQPGPQDEREDGETLLIDWSKSGGITVSWAMKLLNCDGTILTFTTASKLPSGAGEEEKETETRGEVLKIEVKDFKLGSESLFITPSFGCDVVTIHFLFFSSFPLDRTIKAGWNHFAFTRQDSNAVHLLCNGTRLSTLRLPETFQPDIPITGIE